MPYTDSEIRRGIVLAGGIAIVFLVIYIIISVLVSTDEPRTPAPQPAPVATEQAPPPAQVKRVIVRTEEYFHLLPKGEQALHRQIQENLRILRQYEEDQKSVSPKTANERVAELLKILDQAQP